MAKEKTVFVCSACGYETPRWMGKCPGCNAWNTLEEQAPQAVQQAAPVKANKQRPGTGASAMRLSEIPEETSARATSIVFFFSPLRYSRTPASLSAEIRPESSRASTAQSRTSPSHRDLVSQLSSAGARPAT